MVRHLSPERVEALARSGQAVIVDVREASEYRAGHIPRAKHISLGQLVHRLKEVPKDKTVVVVCRSGSRSSKAAELLAEAGFRNVFNMSGGMQKWSGPVQTV
ncbi:SirA family protein [Sulfobacillus acidophilus TPY]|uniref:Rhodanese-like protein n=1 Tax=Sulfobacillus acidophilus (strain ATCC 700253 / DSM 10332 / NAL) TaxID=679936 RepID=G8TVN4_SULAD|nr:SirA family protein [Sulfobacillus acidophilus TPY]AEW03673.1 Rhodanese-like protein [Sulfobacillus acidophilus DSM 10332]